MGLKLFPYGGFSLSKDGDELYLWSATAEDINEYIDSKSFAASFEGVSLRFDQDFAYFGVDNIPGEFGAFRAERCGDIGSPGYTANPGPRFVSINRVANGAYLKWHGVEGKTYRLEYNTKAQATGWLPVGKITAVNSLPAMIDPGARNINRRFYRVVEVLP